MPQERHSKKRITGGVVGLRCRRTIQAQSSRSFSAGFIPSTLRAEQTWCLSQSSRQCGCLNEATIESWQKKRLLAPEPDVKSQNNSFPDWYMYSFFNESIYIYLYHFISVFIILYHSISIYMVSWLASLYAYCKRGRVSKAAMELDMRRIEGRAQENALRLQQCQEEPGARSTMGPCWALPGFTLHVLDCGMQRMQRMQRMQWMQGTHTHTVMQDGVHHLRRWNELCQGFARKLQSLNLLVPPLRVCNLKRNVWLWKRLEMCPIEPKHGTAECEF